MSTILYLRNDDVMKPAPYPIVVEDDGTVKSGLGPDDGSYLVGFGPLGPLDLRSLTVFRADATAENVKGLAPTFSDGKHLFRYEFAVREVVTK